MSGNNTKPTIDAHSSTWAVISELALKQADISRRQIEAYAVDERTADYHRGRISLIYDILKLIEIDK